MILLPEVLKPFLDRYGDVQLTVLEGLSFAGVEAQLRDGSVDFYVGIEPERRIGQEFAVEPCSATTASSSAGRDIRCAGPGRCRNCVPRAGS